MCIRDRAGEASETEVGAAGCPQEMSVKASRIPRVKVKIAFMCMGICLLYTSYPFKYPCRQTTWLTLRLSHTSGSTGTAGFEALPGRQGPLYRVLPLLESVPWGRGSSHRPPGSAPAECSRPPLRSGTIPAGDVYKRQVSMWYEKRGVEGLNTAIKGGADNAFYDAAATCVGIAHL